LLCPDSFGVPVCVDDFPEVRRDGLKVASRYSGVTSERGTDRKLVNNRVQWTGRYCSELYGNVAPLANWILGTAERSASLSDRFTYEK
jgi:hypothetical protein